MIINILHIIMKKVGIIIGIIILGYPIKIHQITKKRTGIGRGEYPNVDAISLLPPVTFGNTFIKGDTLE